MINEPKVTMGFCQDWYEDSVAEASVYPAWTKFT